MIEIIPGYLMEGYILEEHGKNDSTDYSLAQAKSQITYILLLLKLTH